VQDTWLEGQKCAGCAREVAKMFAHLRNAPGGHLPPGWVLMHGCSTRALTAASSPADRSQAEEGYREYLERAILQYDDLNRPREVVALPGLLVDHGAYEPLEEGIRARSGLKELTFVVVKRKVDRADERLQVAKIDPSANVYWPDKCTQLVVLDLHVRRGAPLLARVSDDEPVGQMLGLRSSAEIGELLKTHADDGRERRVILSLKIYHGRFESKNLSREGWGAVIGFAAAGVGIGDA
jgi:hypothetical protein